MEVEGEVHGEENKELREKKMRRRFKTPSQVQGLEDFYNEHKYPTESMKAELAEKLGLTEKQVSGWFCHRRLKDKRLFLDETCATGRQDLSSGVIQDRGSGLRQDSCGSTKQGEYGIADLREVESRRLSGEDRLHPGRNYEMKRQCDLAGKDDTPSESDSDFPENVHTHSRDLMDVKISQYATANEIISRSRGCMGPSGFLKIKGHTENSAITAVKRQLGRHYKEDGPPLGVEFDSLPPGAFETPAKSTIYESYRVVEPMLSGSVDLPVSHRQPPRNVMSNQDPFVEPTVTRPLTGFGKENSSGCRPPVQKPYIPEHDNAFLSKKPPSVVDEYSVAEASVFDSNMRSSNQSKHGHVGVGPIAFSDSRVHPSGGRFGSELTEPVMHHYGDVNPKVHRRERLDSKASTVTIGRKDSFYSGARLLPKKMTEDEELYREIKTKREHHDPIRACNRRRNEILRSGFIRRSPLHDHPPFPKLKKRPAVEMPSSCSEDETAVTNSSLD